MKWVLALHIISMVAWFAGLFYLPRLFVYHTMTQETNEYQRFRIMEHKLFYYITTPAGIATSFFGFWLLYSNEAFYAHLWWMHIKLIAVALLWVFHLYCGRCVWYFKHNRNPHSEKFFRFFNEIPTILLFIIIIMAIVQPF